MLSINSISIQNFRQYKNLSLKFEDKKGIYLFLGKNGIGKSNFLNAICWCLYGEQPFRFNDSDKTLLNEDVAKDFPYEEVKVKIEVGMDDKLFLFQRTQRESQRSYLTVMIMHNQDWKPINNPTVIVNSFLPRSIRKFFLFDGEDVQNLFKEGYASNLKDGIWKVSNVELLDNALEHMKTLRDELRRVISRDEPETEDLDIKLRDLEKILNSKTSEENNIQENLIKLKKNEEKLNEELKNYEKYRDLQEKRQDLLVNHQQSTERTNNNQKEIDNLVISLAPLVLIKDSLLQFAKEIASARKKGEIPPKIKTTFIQELLDREKCICGTHLNKKSKEYMHLLGLMNESVIADSKSYLVDDSYEINSLLKEINILPERMRNLRERRSKERTILEKIEIELNEISEQLKNSPDKAVGDLESTLRTMRDEIIKSSQDLALVQNDIKQYVKEVNETKEILDRLNKSKSKRKTDFERFNFINTSLEQLETIRNKLISQVRRAVSYNTDKIFKELIWEKGKFEKVEFSENYEVLVIGKGVKDIEDLSTGERKVLGFATIKALAYLSGFKDVPVIIDGPLEYLDPEVQENFLTLLPKFTPEKQLFVFSVDREIIKEFGKANIEKNNFYNLIRQTNTTNTLASKFIN